MRILHSKTALFLLSVTVTIAVSLMILVLFRFFFPFSQNPANKQTSTDQPQVTTMAEPFFVQSSPSPSPSAEPVRILFGGDMMFDRHIRQHGERIGYETLLQPLSTLFNEYDLVMANFEGPVTDFKSVSVGSAVGSHNNFLFTFDPKVASAAASLNIKVVSLGNNHICNFGREGVKQTHDYLQQAGIGYFGYTCADTPHYLIQKYKNLNIGFVSYNQFLPDGDVVALQAIKTVRPQVDVVVIHAHWGNEYQTTAAQPQRTLAHQFVDAGADLVIGAHPHVIQDSEMYKGKKIYYSLGNFVFDQYFQKEVKEGMLVGTTIHSKDKMEFEEYRIQLQTDGITTLQK